MKTYILISFITLLLGALAMATRIQTDHYPRKTEYTMGSDVLTMIVRLALAFWAGILLWL